MRQLTTAFAVATSMMAVAFHGGPAVAAPIAIDFEGAGYPVGALSGTPTTGTTKWSDGNSVGEIVQPGGVGTNKEARTRTTAATNLTATYALTNAALGVTGSPTALEFGLDLKLVSAEITGNILDFFIAAPTASQTPIRLQLYGNGDVRIRATTSGTTSMVAAGLLADGQFHRVHGVIDYAQSTYDIFVDDATTPAVNDQGFLNAGPYASYGTLRVNTRAAADATPGGAANVVAFDNLYFDVVAIPEPSTLGVAGLGGLAMLRRRRRSKVAW